MFNLLIYRSRETVIKFNFPLAIPVANIVPPFSHFNDVIRSPSYAFKNWRRHLSFKWIRKIVDWSSITIAKCSFGLAYINFGHFENLG